MRSFDWPTLALALLFLLAGAVVGNTLRSGGAVPVPAYSDTGQMASAAQP
jgi:hypothetical protein